MFWLFLAMSAKINTDYFPYVDWITIPLLIPFALANRFRFRRLQIPGGFPAVLMLAVMALTALVSAHDLKSILQVAKLAIVLMVLYSLFLAVPAAARVGMQVASLAAVLNALCLVLGRAGISALIEPYGDGRWTTVFNYVGALAFLGIFAFGHAAYSGLHSRSGLVWHLTVALSSIWIVISDGSRTGALALILIFIYVATTAIPASPSSSRARFRLAIVLLVVVAIGSVGSAVSANSPDSSPVPIQGRVTKLFSDRQGGFQDTLQAADIARFQAMLAALNAISSHPLWGRGFETTFVVLDGTVVLVHNAYLQTWADLGLFGCLAFIGVILWWIPRLPRALRRIRFVRDVKDRAFVHGSITAVAGFAFTCLYHPLSVEVTEWIRFIVPSAILFQFTQICSARVSRPPKRHGQEEAA